MTSISIPELEPLAVSEFPGHMPHASSQGLCGELAIPHTEGEELEEPILPPRQKFKDPSWMTKNAGKRIHLIAHWEVKSSFEPVKSTGGYEFLCSYSWKQTVRNTIYVPGTPLKWTPPALPKQLAPDTGFHWCDQHGHRVPRHQFEPVFQALVVMNPTVRFNNIDIVVNRNTLQKLFNFFSFKRGQAFHVDLDMVKNTLFIGRREAKAKTKQYSGYRRNFEEAFTTEDPQLPESQGHHRIIRYRFGGLNLLVRIEADGYYPKGEDDEDSPDEFFRNVFGTATQTTIQHCGPHLTIAIAQGTMVPHNNTLELNSRSSKGAAFEQMWFGRTPYLCIAKHKKGSRGFIEAADVIRIKQSEFEEWEVKNQKHLVRLAWFLSELRRVTVEKTGLGAAVLVMTEKGAPLQIYEAKSSSGALPKEIVAQFWD
jgi:phage anti-repressor protein